MSVTRLVLTIIFVPPCTCFTYLQTLTTQTTMTSTFNHRDRDLARPRAISCDLTPTKRGDDARYTVRYVRYARYDRYTTMYFRPNLPQFHRHNSPKSTRPDTSLNRRDMDLARSRAISRDLPRAHRRDQARTAVCYVGYARYTTTCF